MVQKDCIKSYCIKSYSYLYSSLHVIFVYIFYSLISVNFTFLPPFLALLFIVRDASMCSCSLLDYSLHLLNSNLLSVPQYNFKTALMVLLKE